MKDFKQESENWMFADLHIHSRFSRACSKDLNLDNLVKWAKIKGLDVLGTGDFSHPKWIEEIRKELEDNGEGFYIHKKTRFPFIITGEISLIYTDNGVGRKVHLVILLPSIEIADKVNSYFDKNNLRRDYDGRPIFGVKCDKFVADLRAISEDIEIIPAHIWTPYFGVFGSMSGFNSLKECFKEQNDFIYAIETGISSDPEMNWNIKELENRAIVSFSDAHSYWPWRLGREATIFQKTNSYLDLIKQIRENKIIGTIEVDPSYGKYHWDGHRNCNYSCSPEKTKKLDGMCPVCGKPLTVGVEYRVDELSEKTNVKDKKMFYKVLPLHEIISLYTGVGVNSKKVWVIYNELIQKFENEFNVLLFVQRDDFVKAEINSGLIDLILLNRNGNIKVEPGYDGEYGKAVLGNLKQEKQRRLF